MAEFKWEELILRFPHLAERILEKLDNQSLVRCRFVGQSLKDLIDDKNYPWKRIVQQKILKYGNSLLHAAVESCQSEMFQKMFNEETEKSPKNQWNETPFHFACKLGHFDIAEVIVKNSTKLNIDLNVKDCSGFTGFHLACNFGQTKVVELLIKNYSAKMISYGATGFELFCLEGQPETDSDQLKIDFNIKDKYGWTGFHWACERDRIEIVELLIKNSAEKNIFLNAKDDFGWTTGFHLACKKGRKRIVELLINSPECLDLNAKSKDGRTGYQLAKIFSNFDIVELIESNA